MDKQIPDEIFASTDLSEMFKKAFKIDESGKVSISGFFHLFRTEENDWDTYLTVRDDDGMPFCILNKLVQFVGKDVKITIELLPQQEPESSCNTPYIYQMCGMTADAEVKRNNTEYEYWMKLAEKENKTGDHHGK